MPDRSKILIAAATHTKNRHEFFKKLREGRGFDVTVCKAFFLGFFFFFAWRDFLVIICTRSHFQKKRVSSATSYPHAGGYPHQPLNSSVGDELAALGFGGIPSATGGAGGTSGGGGGGTTSGGSNPPSAGPSSLAFMLPPDFSSGLQQQQQQQGRSCEVHMNTFQPTSAGVVGPGVPGPMPPGVQIPGHHVVPGLNLQSGCDMVEHVCTLILCCGTRGLLSKFPSRAQRIDVISRFIFPLIFAIFNLAYWLYYLFAKSRSPQLEG